jgi:hypothetical protein
VRRIPYVVSLSVATFSGTAGREKLGQPVPESNLVSELNKGAPQQTQLYMPGS